MMDTWQTRFDEFFSVVHSKHVIKSFIHAEIERCRMETHQAALRTESGRMNKMLERQVGQCIEAIETTEPFTKEELIRVIKRGLL